MAGLSADIELVRPAFTAGDTPGADAPRWGDPGTLHLGMLAQYEKDPLLLYRYGDEDAAVISDRIGLAIGASLDFSKRFGGRLTLPFAYDIAGDATAYTGGGFGSGDVAAGVRAFIWQIGPVALGAHADLLFPVGTADAWKGEAGVRGFPGLVVSIAAGPIAIHNDTAVMLRAPLDTGADFTLGSELVENTALVAAIWPDHLWVHAGANVRVGLESLPAGSAETVAEALVGAKLSPTRSWGFDLGIGRGLTEGYGTSRFRAFLGATFTFTPKPPPPDPVAASFTPAIENVPDQLIIEQIAVPPPKPAWSVTELARVEQDQIVIRDPIQFEFAKDVILPVSLPTMSFVGRLLQDHPEIVHLVIEGHASEEGSFYYNYDLAKRRADAIWRALVEAGVSPTRISTRSMGEVEPTRAGEDETSLAENRRVNFHIVRRLRPGELPPEYKLQIKQPWTGDPETLPTPPPPPAPPTPPPPVELPPPDAQDDLNDGLPEPGTFDDQDDP